MNLLEIDTNQLFRDNSIAELQEIQSKIKYEIEKKREELRTTVGERYRDLLTAADTITNMRNTAATIVSSVNDVTILSKGLQEKHLVGFKTEENKIISTSRSEDISQMLEIKLLIGMPERIWSALDRHELTYAAELYLLAQHIHLRLKLSHAVEKYPLINTHWITVEACLETILDAAYRDISKVSPSLETCTDSLCACLLLETSNIEEILRVFVNKRCAAFAAVLDCEAYPTVKEKLLDAVLLVQATYLTASFCFFGEDNDGCIQKKLAEITAKTALPTVSKLPAISPLAEQHLSDHIASFRPSTTRSVTKISKDTLSSACRTAMKEFQNMLDDNMKSLLGVLNSLQLVLGVRDLVSSVKNPPGWDTVENIFGPLQVHFELLGEHVYNRTRALISSELNKIFLCVNISLSELDETFKKDGTIQSEHNLRWFIWRESEKDETGAQTSGMTPRVTSFCQQLEKLLLVLFEDVNAYLAGVTEKSGLTEYFNSTCYDALNRFAEKQVELSKKASSESSIIVRARILHALTSQCPILKKCIWQPEEASRKGQAWPDAVVFLQNASLEVWRAWKAIYTSQMQSTLLSTLDSDLSITSYLLSRPACEVVTITEETEENQSVTSEIRVPSQPSFTLQNFLLKVCQRLNSVSVHTLPRAIHLELIEAVATMILEHYDNLVSSSERIHPSQAWQILLDVRFLGLIMLPRDNQDATHKLCSKLESIIDPFDFNVCYPYLQANVKKSAVRLQGTFGVLIDYNEKLAVLNSLKVGGGPTSTNSNDDPNVLATSTGVPWFPLLPISSGHNKKKEESPSKIKQRGKEPKKESTSSDFVKSAGAFFGAMTGGWT